MSEQRLFIAVEPPDEVRRAIYNDLEPVRSGLPFVRWEPPEKFHITVKFLGTVPGMKYREIRQAMEDVTADMHSFQVILSGLGAFPHTRRARVVWIGVQSGMEELEKLYSKVEGAFDAIGFPGEKRRFSAHITVGRIKHPRFIDLASLRTGEYRFRARHLSVIRSRLTPKGSIYTTVAEYPFHLQGGRSSE